MPESPPPPWLVEAWRLCYLDPLAARALAAGQVQAPGAEGAWALLHLALADARVGPEADAWATLQQARLAFAAADAATDRGSAPAAGPRWCDEVEAIALRRAGRHADSAALQRRLDDEGPLPTGTPGLPDPVALLQFVADNSRANTAKLCGDMDGALRHLYAAHDAAGRCGLAGPRIVALANLGALNQDLFNLEDARRLSEQALAEASAAGAPQMLGAAAANLITIYNACGQPQCGRDMLSLLLREEPRLLPGMQQRYALQLALAQLGVGEYQAAMARLLPARPGQACARTSDGDGDRRILWHWLHARCLLAMSQPDAAASSAEEALAPQGEADWRAHPYPAMELLRAAADAHEQRGAPIAALARLRQAQALHEMLVGRSARARFVALEVGWRLKAAQQERDNALQLQQRAEAEQHRLRELNDALQHQIRETRRLHEQLREQALRDALTGLHNRRHLFEAAPGLLQRALREGTPLAVAMIDLDHFKRLNDQFGHGAGDEVLRQFARLLREQLRAGDLVCRHGGEEFVVVAPAADAAATQACLLRLLQTWQGLPLRHEDQPLPAGSFSAGVSQLGDDGADLDALLRAADAALYTAKAQGRARVVARAVSARCAPAA